MKANLGSVSPAVSRVATDHHPGITVSMTALADNGTLPEGELVAKDADGLIVAYDPDGTGETASLAMVVGVLLEELDTAEDDTALVLRHGTVRREALKVAAAAAGDDDVAALAAIGIYAM